MMNLNAALDFIQDEMTLPDGRRLREVLVNDPWIVDDVLRPILAVGKDGLPQYPSAWIGLSRGSAKTFYAAAIAMTEALRGDGSHIFVIASDVDQGKLLTEAMDAFCLRNPRLAALFERTKTEWRCPSTGSRVRVMASDVASFFGLAGTAQRLRIVCDEFCSWPPESRELYNAILTTLPKVPDSQLLVISNAGILGSWQHDTYIAAEANGTYIFAPEGVIASWIRPADLERARAALPGPVYERFYENRWAGSGGAAIALDDWDACLDASLPPLGEQENVIIGVDAGITGDSFAIVGVSRDPAQPEDSIAVRDVRIWTPPSGGSVDFDLPWQYLRDFCKAHEVIQIAFDAYQLHDFMTRFAREFSIWCEPFSQMGARAEADVALSQLIRSKRLRHGGDAELRSHVENCVWKMSSNSSQTRFVKSASSKKIDAAVALSMAASECLRLRLA